MSRHCPGEVELTQDDNTAKLVMNTFFKVVTEDGVTASDIAKYLQEKFGDVWRVSALTGKAEDTLRKSAALGFLARHGDRYIANIVREARCCRRRRRRRRSCRRRRRRRGCRPRRRLTRCRKRKRSCCCGA